MKTVTNLYILNLAFADEFFLIGRPKKSDKKNIDEIITVIFLSLSLQAYPS